MTKLNPRQIGGVNFDNLKIELGDLRTRVGYFYGQVNTQADLPLTPALDSQAFVKDLRKWVYFDGALWKDITAASSGGGSTAPATGGVGIDITMGLAVLANYFRDAESRSLAKQRVNSVMYDVFTDASNIDTALSTTGFEVLNGQVNPATINKAPRMTSNTTPTPYVITASGTYNTDAPWKALDGGTDEGTRQFWYVNGTPPTGGHWWKIDFGSAMKISKISLNAFVVSSPNCSIKDWELYGSNDNTTFTKLTYGTHANTNTEETYSFSNNTAYRYYRINLLTGYANSSAVGIKEVKLFEINTTAIIITKTEHFTAEVDNILFSAEYVGNPTFDLSVDDGMSWISNVTPNTLIDVSSYHGSDIRIRVNLVNGDFLQSIGFISYNTQSLASVSILSPEAEQRLTDMAINLAKTNLRLAALQGASRYGMKNMIVDDFKDNSGINFAKTTATYDSSTKSVNTGLGPNQIPTMTAATTGAVTISASAVYSGNVAWYAGDKDLAKSWYVNNNTLPVEGSHWLRVDFGTGKSINGVSFRCANINSSVKDFRLQGSNDSSNWTTLCTGTVTKYDLTECAFTFQNDISYRYYRVLVDSSYSSYGKTYCGIAELGLFAGSVTSTELVSVTETLTTAPVKVLLTTDVTIGDGTIAYQVSRDNGTTWTDIPPDTLTDISTQPSDVYLVVKAIMSGVVNLNAWSYCWN